MVDKDIEYTDEVLQEISQRVIKSFLEDCTEMDKHILLEILDALEKGKNVHEKLMNSVFVRPFMEKFIDEIIKYEEG